MPSLTRVAAFAGPIPVTLVKSFMATFLESL